MLRMCWLFGVLRGVHGEGVEALGLDAGEEDAWAHAEWAHVVDLDPLRAEILVRDACLVRDGKVVAAAEGTSSTTAGKR